MKELPDLCLAYGNSDEYRYASHLSISTMLERYCKIGKNQLSLMLSRIRTSARGGWVSKQPKLIRYTVSSFIRTASFSSAGQGNHGQAILRPIPTDLWLPRRIACYSADIIISKLTTTIVSTFSAYYTYLWPKYFDDPLTPPLPSFDGRAVCYPSDCNLRDYMSWRQVDCKCYHSLQYGFDRSLFPMTICLFFGA